MPAHRRLSLVLALLLVASSIPDSRLPSALAQQTADARFEASSVKRNMSGDAGGGMRIVGARFEATNVTCITSFATGHDAYQIAHGGNMSI